MKTKSLPQIFLPFLALMTCFVVQPATATAQTMSVPYTQGFENSSSSQLPDGWSQNGVLLIDENANDAHSGSRSMMLYCGNNVTTAILPQFNVNINTLTMDFWVKPIADDGYTHSSNDYVSVGYRVNNTYTEVQRYYYTGNDYYHQRRTAFVNAPSGARIVIQGFCNSHTYWVIDDVDVYTTTSPVMDLPYVPGFFANIPVGWVSNNYNYRYGIFGIGIIPYLSTGYTVFPEFTRPLYMLKLRIPLRPQANAQNIQIGYITNPNSLSTFTALETYQSWCDGNVTSWQEKTITYCFRDIPTNARIAIVCNGDWDIPDLEGIRVEEVVEFEQYGITTGWIIPSTMSVTDNALQGTGVMVFPRFDQSIATAALDMMLKPGSGASMVSIGYITNPNNPSGSFVSIGILASNPSSSWTGFQKVGYDNLQAFNNYSNGRLALKFQGTWMLNWAHLYEHFVLLPATSQALNTLMLDIDVRPNGSSNRTLQIGYVTNPNDQTTFTALQTIDATYYWSHYNSVRVDYAGAPANAARMALVYSGGSWDYQNVSVSVSSPIDVPYTAVLPTTGQPEGWMANNYYYSNDSGGYAYLSFGCAVLPQFTTPIGVLQLDIDISPTGSENRTMRIGYLTNPNDQTTFTALQSFTAYSNWHYYLTKRVSFYGAPAGARIAIVCEDSWKIQNVNVHQPTPISVPYTAVLPTTGQPEGWIANNYNYTTNYYGEYAYLSSGCAVLPKFTTPIPPLQLEIDISPTGSENRTMQIGYLTNPNDQTTFTALQSFTAYSNWHYYLTKRVSFYGAPAGARIAIVCEDSWKIQNVNVHQPTPISVPYTAVLPTTGQPEGWIANNYNYTTNYYGEYAYLSSGCAVLPKFTTPIPPLQLEIDISPTGSENRTMQIGYLTNPNDQSTFVALQTISAYSSWNSYRTKRVSFYGAPADARIAIVCDNTWKIQNVNVRIPSISIPYTQDFEDLDVGSLPDGWYAPNMSVKGTYNSVAPHGGTKQLVGEGYIMLPVVENADYNALMLSLYARPNMTYYGGRLRIGYIPNGGTLSQFVEIKNVTWDTNVSDYQQINTSLSGIPADARLALYCFGNSYNTNLWHLDDLMIHQYVEPLPYSEGFEEEAVGTLPEGWLADNMQVGTHPYGNDNPHAGSHQLYGSGLAILPIFDEELDGLQATLWMRPSAGTFGMQFHVGYITDPNDASTFVTCKIFYADSEWTQYRDKHVSFYSPDSPIPNGARMAIKAVTVGSACWYVDDLLVTASDPTPPTVSLDNVGLHHAEISWVPAHNWQDEWDVFVIQWMPYDMNNYSLAELEDMGDLTHLDNGALSFVIDGLTAGEDYYAYVRYRSLVSGNNWETSLWSDPVTIETEQNCAPPTNLHVEVTQHTALVTWDPGQSNQTSWYTYGGNDDMDGETVTEPFRLLTGLEPGEEYEISVTGICEDGDGDSEGISMTFTTLSLPSLTANDDDDTNDDVPITNDNCGSQLSRTQFIIPASQLIDMQYSHLQSLTFESGFIVNGQPWGEDARFKVYLKVVSQDDFSDGEFYDWDELYCIGSYSPIIHSHLMTISLDDYNQFYYTGGNLLVGFYQEQYDFTPGQNFGHVDWLGVNNYNSNPNYKPSIYYNIYYEEPFAQTFAPKVTFSYEPDDYLPPTNFQATVTGVYEVTFSWTPSAGQTATEIMVCGSPDFVGNQFLTNSTDDHCTVVSPDFFEPEETYYYRYHGVYNVDGENHYSAWSAVGSFTMPDACEPPANVQVTQVTPFSTQLSWNGSGEYEYVEYRELNTQWEEGFEGGALPSGWASIANGTGTAAGQWAVYQSISQTSPHTGSYLIRSVGILNPNVRTDNWLILPQITLGGALKFWACTAMGEQQSFSVYVSTTGTTVADFGTEPIQTCSTTSSYQEFTIDLSGYEGLGYVAIRYQFDGVTGSTSVALAIDDVSYHYGGTWTSAGSTESGQIDLYDLTPGATYQARVRAMCETGYASSWTTPVSFSTPGNIVFEDENVKEICVDNWDTNGDGELSYAEAAAVTTLNPSGATNSSVFKNNQAITSFNELQYFTGLTEIDNYAFAGCASLSAITLPSTITSIGNNAFGFNSQDVGCTSLHSIVIPPSVTTIGAFAFRKSGLTEVDLPYSVTQIGTLAFGDCNNLVSVYLPASVTDINANAFTGAALANIDVDAGNPVYDSRNGCNAIISTANNVLVTGCKNTVVPYGVIAIGSSAFENCSNLTDITLPATVISLAGYAFLNCTSLNTIEVNATTPPTFGGSTFGNLTSGNIKVYVPCGSLETYQDSDWSGFDLVENCNIVFEDNLTKELCVNAWDRNFDGELSYREAAAVTSLNNEFYGSNITRFNELQYFTGLTSIGEEDFGDCERLVAVTLPPTVTQIYNYAFENCTSLTSITFGENIGTIWDYAFSGCDGLWFIKVEATTPPSLGEDAFYGAEIDIPVYVPCGTKTVYQNDSDWDIFEDYNIVDMCDTIHFADAAVRAICLDNWDTNDDGYLSYGEAAAVTSIGEVFSGNLSIQTFNELWYFTGLTEISDNAFMGCAWLSSIEMPPTIAHIGSLAFYNTQLNNMYIPYATRTIGWLAFGSCNRLASVYIPASVTYIEGNPFSNCPALNNIWVDSGNPVYDSRNNCKAIIETATNTLVTGGKNTVIPDDVTALGSYAFSGQTAITSITIPSTVVEMGNGVFENCTGLTEVNVQAETPPTLGYNVFEGVNTVDVWVYVPCGTQGDYENDDDGWGQFYYIIDPCANIYFEDANVKAICVANFDTNNDGEISYAEAAAVITLNPSGESTSSVFKGTSITTFNELQYFTGLTSIEYVAFNGCRSLTSITLPHTVTTIANSAFGGCNVLSSITIPASVTSIGQTAFISCYALTTIDLPDNLTTIGNQAFYNCTGLTSIVIPASVTSIGTGLFRKCPALESIMVETDNQTYDSRDGCNAIIETTTNKLIAGCKNTVIPDGITAIESAAFYDCTGLTSVTLPGSISSIGVNAFNGCTGLQSLTVLRVNPPFVGNNAFNNVPAGIPVNVPCESVADYQAATGWSAFSNIVGIDCQEVTQTIALSAGWNWFSSYIEVENPIAMLQMLETSLGENGVEIRNSHTNTEYDSEWGWWGDLDEEGMTNEQMYKILVSSPCTIILEGTPANPAVHPITVNPGWNWIGFPSGTQISLEVAFAGFVQEGDRIRNSSAEIEYDPEWGWFGDFETLEPGQGYMYYSASSTPRTLVFPASAK